MKKKMLGFKVVVIIAILVIVGSVLLNKKDLETIEYEGETYVYLEYRNDMFVYDYLSDDNFEVEEIYPIKIGEWDGIYSEGDLFIVKDQIKDAANYYSDDENYSWYFILEEDDTEKEYGILLDEKEKEYLYDLDDKKKEVTITFDDIKYFGSIKKVSKDGVISGVITLVNVDNKWYWKSEVMKDDSNEYVIALPESLNKKLNAENN